MRYTLQGVLDYLDQNFAILDVGFESGVTLSDIRVPLGRASDNHLKPDIILRQDLSEPENDKMIARNVALEN